MRYKLTCGCCRGPEEDRCVCHVHQDVSRGRSARTCSDCRERSTCFGFTRQELDDAFKLVAPEGDWKGRIDAAIPADRAPVVGAAIRFFTATEPHFNLNPVPGWWQVTAVGYRAGPAGP